MSSDVVFLAAEGLAARSAILTADEWQALCGIATVGGWTGQNHLFIGRTTRGRAQAWTNAVRTGLVRLLLRRPDLPGPVHRQPGGGPDWGDAVNLAGGPHFRDILGRVGSDDFARETQNLFNMCECSDVIRRSRSDPH